MQKINSLVSRLVRQINPVRLHIADLSRLEIGDLGPVRPHHGDPALRPRGRVGGLAAQGQAGVDGRVADGVAQGGAISEIEMVSTSVSSFRKPGSAKLSI